VLAHWLPAGPTYDPWAWIIWGREITEWDLDTRTGPSWKPLPVLFTAPFALAGDAAAPELWLIVAQFGGLLAVAFTYRLAARLAGPTAGLIAAAGLALADEFIRNFARGNSEGLLVALCLWAIERHLDGRRRDAFLLGVAAGLLRPELWPFLLLYGLWLMWTDPRTRIVVLGCGALTVIAWLVPEYLGSGDPIRAAARAREPNPDSAAFADFPFLETFRRASAVLMAPMLLGAALAVARAWRARDRVRLILCGVAAALMIAVAAMTQVGFAGNLRYVALPAALVCVLAGAGWVELVRDAARRFGRAPARRTGRRARRGRAAVRACGRRQAALRPRRRARGVRALRPVAADRREVRRGGGAAALRAGLRAAVRGAGGRLGDARSLLPGRDLRQPARDRARRTLLGARARPTLPGDQQKPALVRRSQLPRPLT
jgi:hypothetical protein